MRLSEAMRLGAMVTAPDQGVLIRWSMDGRPVSACALGAAAVALGAKVGEPWQRSEQSGLLEWTGPCPVGRCSPRDVDSMVIHLNDYHYWSREQIADWVETIEQRLEAVHGVLHPGPGTEAEGAATGDPVPSAVHS